MHLGGLEQLLQASAEYVNIMRDRSRTDAELTAFEAVKGMQQGRAAKYVHELEDLKEIYGGLTEMQEA
jgi:hypothetical protein